MPQKKRIRPPRGSGLRSRAGCIPCRLRHRKCDETRPLCGDCNKTGRRCEWPLSNPSAASVIENAQTREPYLNHTTISPISGTSPVLESEGPPLETSGGTSTEDCSPGSAHNAHPASQAKANDDSVSARGERDHSQWLDFLMDGTYSDMSPQEIPLAIEAIESSIKASFPLAQWDVEEVSNPAGLGENQEQQGRRQEAHMGRWENNEPAIRVELSSEEMVFFRNYIHKCSRWLDIFDVQEHFAGYIAQMALFDVGLMNAILALSAHHMVHEQRLNNKATTTEAVSAVQFYSKSLSYVQQAMQYPAYSRSEELLATALLVSTYEMMNGSMEGWSRHLKGIFWIQRSQNVNSMSLGARRAVWWVWIRQEPWAAFREQRKSFSYWVPPEPMANQTPDQLSMYITIILRGAINFAAPRDEGQPLDIQFLTNRMQMAEKMLRDLDEWHHFIGPSIQPLPSDESCCGSEIPAVVLECFKPIWIHPPRYAAATQAYHFARILIYLNQPLLNGLSTDKSTRKALHEGVASICGIAITLEDDSCQIMSLQCLYGAGLCEHDEMRQKAIMALIERSERRSGWPADELKKDLLRHWQKA